MPGEGRRISINDRYLWLYGHHAVAAALQNPRRRIRAIAALPESEEWLAERIGAARAKLGAAEIQILAREPFEMLLPDGAVHQGVAIRTEFLPEKTIDDVINALAEGAPAVVVLLDRVSDPHNVGAVMRSAAAFGAAAVVLPEHGAPPVTGVLAKAASGALEHVALLHVINLVRTMEKLKAAGFWCIGLDGGGERTLAEGKPSGRVALVLGSEGGGLRRLTRERCDLLARLPTRGAIGSLNVSNAAAIALYEVVRTLPASAAEADHEPDDGNHGAVNQGEWDDDLDLDETDIVDVGFGEPGFGDDDDVIDDGDEEPFDAGADPAPKGRGKR